MVTPKLSTTVKVAWSYGFRKASNEMAEIKTETT